MPEFLVALDAGTTAVKAVVFDAQGSVVGRASAEFGISFPRPGWVEQDPTAVWETSESAMRQAVSAAGVQWTDVAAIGITNQRSSVVAWSAATGRALAPMLSWQDTRAAERCAALLEQGFFITPMMAASKAEWLVANVDAVSEAASASNLRLGTPNSWIAACLCGDVHSSDHGNASATGFYNFIEPKWDPTVMETLGINPTWLPTLVPSAGEIGRTRKELFGTEIPVAGMAGDQQASLFGLGCFAPGATKCSFGTSAMITANTAEGLTLGAQGTYPIVAWRMDDVTTFSLEGQVITAGAAIQWLRDGLGIIEDPAASADLARSVPDTGGVWVVPAFQGLGTPIMDEGARAMIGGLSRSSTAGHIARALLEGVAHRVADVAESLWCNVAQPALLRVDGGASRNDFLLQAQADLLGLVVERPMVVEGSAAGAAGLAAIGVGLWSGPQEAAGLHRADRVFEPSLDDAERDERRALWRCRLQAAAEVAR